MTALATHTRQTLVLGCDQGRRGRHRELAGHLRAILANVRRDHADAHAQALRAAHLRRHEAETYRRLRILRALLCDVE